MDIESLPKESKETVSDYTTLSVIGKGNTLIFN